VNESSHDRLVILGPPGAGKGTQGKLLAETLRLRHIASGDLVRQHQANETALGVASQTYYSLGLLVPDVITFQIVLPAVLEASNGFLLDGFPRNIHQAERLDQELGLKNLQVDHTLLITVPQEEIMRRLASRRVCTECKRIYQVNSTTSNAPEICDSCLVPLIQRKDDTPDAIRIRMEEYHAQTLPLAEYYRSQNKLLEVSGLGSVQNVLHRALRCLGVPIPSENFANRSQAGQPNPGWSFKKRHV
jgi:adenylate kinase